MNVRDLAKSMMSCGWAMSVFGVQQMLNIMKPAPGADPCAKAAKAFNDVTNATANTLDDCMKSAFQAGADLQSGMIDMMFGGMMSTSLDPNRWMRMGSDTLNRMRDLGKRASQATAEAAGRTTGAASPSQTGSTVSSGAGWGPMPR
jgi:hypothetical protein